MSASTCLVAGQRPFEIVARPACARIVTEEPPTHFVVDADHRQTFVGKQPCSFCANQLVELELQGK
jgi:hypothetical protein